MRGWAWMLSFAVGLSTGCGARTGLRVDPGQPLDDAGASPDVPPTPPTCRPLRVRAQVGVEAALRAEVDNAPAGVTGAFRWSVRSAPTRSMARVTSTGDTTARITPDATGVYTLDAATPYTAADGTALVCPVVVEADPADPLCPEYALEEPTVVALPLGALQFAFERGWSTPRVNRGGDGRGGLVASDAPADDTAALVHDFTVTDGRALETVAGEWEARVLGAVGATPVLVGRPGTTPDGIPLRRSSFRVVSAATTAAVVRDRVARDAVGLNPGAAAQGFSAATRFVVEVTTALDRTTGRGALLVSAAPEPRFDDVRAGVAVRLQDVTNGTGLARVGARLDVECRRIVATRTVTADFLWLVDTSRSMEDDQGRLGNTASRFFREMNAAGIDFRVGVVQAGSDARGPDLDDPGFAFIPGAAADGPQRLAWAVTYQRYNEDPRDDARPYPLLGGEEEPLAAAVVTTEALDRRAADLSDARRFRPGATRALFFVTDEAGTNDDARYFAMDRVRWGALREDRVLGVTEYFRTRGYLTFAMANVFVRQPCPSLENFVTCVSVGNGGAYIPLSTANDAEVSAALSRIVDAVAGAASEFALPRAPLSSTLRVRVDATAVPRSRADGFDYDDVARSLVFRGGTYRPRMGQAVRAAYFYWATP